jgi:hypothetical protein
MVRQTKTEQQGDLSLAELSASLGVCTRTIARMVALGRFPEPDFFIGRLPRWSATTIDGWKRVGGCQPPPPRTPAARASSRWRRLNSTTAWRLRGGLMAR